ncbi:hypothetical protein [Clostridium celatum]|nr:hypothetical protein [Clostridium celatum]MBP3931317.1 hypothetical protein [Peptostreptococcaceae bacterium]MDU6297186.1 hypothetical protein [Clostridium celatum]
MIEIEVKYTEDNKKKTRKFNNYELFGLWVANNYDSILIHDVIQSEE